MDNAAKVALIKRLSGDIHRRLSEGPAAALDGPTACAEWDVGTVAAHLAGGAIRQRDAMLRGRDGNGGPPPGEETQPTPDQVQQSNAVNNVQTRNEWGDALLDNFQQGYESLDDTLQSWSDWSIGCWHRRRGTITAESYVDLRIQELVIHDWDIRSGGIGVGELDGEGIVALLPASGMWYQLCFRPTAPLTTPATYRFDIGGGSEGAALQHDVVVTGDGFTVSECSPERQPELTVRANAGTYLLCLYNRVDWNTAKRAGRIRVSQTADTIAHVALRNLGRWFGGL
ncbi:MAG: maleylpyruvate isomerase family protein [Chloroflexi bacterium]|nr:maleylpyruvate isomerase family protein [Chloroflexota bacterium]MYD48976.1 maleylpyruvate isomerase family protein [Chloroflexota bacterium]